MKVIGLSPLDKDSTVTIVEDGEITYAAAEERFTRVKLQDGFPWRALADALQATGTDPRMFSPSCIRFSAWQEETRLFERNLANEREFLDEAESPETSAGIEGRSRAGAAPDRRDSRPPRSQRADGKGLAKTLAYGCSPTKAWCRGTWRSEARPNGAATRRRFTASGTRSSNRRCDDFGLARKLKRVEHHASHAANAYYTSGFDEALIVTLDGYGSGLAGSVGIGRKGGNRAHPLPASIPHSLGTFYESVTSALGFQPSRHEGKIVGPRRLRRSRRPPRRAAVAIRPGGRELPHSSRATTSYFARLLATQFPKIDVAAAYQHVLERVACDVRRPLHSEDRLKQPRAVGRRRRQRQAESAANEICRRRAHLHPPEHG